MSMVEPLYLLAGVSPSIFSKEEIYLLEVDLFTRICEELKEFYKTQHKDYFRIIKLNAEMENAIMETKFISSIINDIVLTREYSLKGVACYTHSTEDVIFEVASGKNSNPSSMLLRKIIELHRTVRPNLYPKKGQLQADFIRTHRIKISVFLENF